MTSKRICFVTGSRAEYGLLHWLMKEIQSDPQFILQIICTNMHLSPEFGLTYRQIETDGFTIDRKVEMLLSSDTPVGTVKSMGLAMIGLADAYTELAPDMLVMLGDRYEILAAASAALAFHIPIAHIHGGEITEGAYDDAIRHAVTKLSHLHFTSTETYRNRVIQMGEPASRVFNVGALGIENIKKMNLLSRKEFEESIEFRLLNKNILVTYHPVTLESATNEEQFDQLLEALRELKDVGIIFTYPNSDAQGRTIIDRIKKFIQSNHINAIVVPSLGQLRYFSALQYMDAVVGNSSSGIIEVPSFNIPTVNIGNRQKGRVHADSVINCSAKAADIGHVLHNILYHNKPVIEKTVNPYERENTVSGIINEIKSFLINTNALNKIKHFNDLT